MKARSGFIAALTLLIALALPLNMAGQETTAKPNATPAKPKKGAQPQPDEGSVADGVYSEKFFLLRYAIPPGWVVKTGEMREGIPGQENAMLLLSTFAKAAPSTGEINSSVNITAESAAAYPDVKTADDYMDSITEFVTSKGFSVLNPPGEISIGGVPFLRSDFQKQEGDLTTYQATMVTMQRGYILQVTAISGDEEQLTPLLNRVRITAPPTMRKPQ